MISDFKPLLAGVAVLVFVFSVTGGCSSSNRAAMPDAATNPDVIAVYGDDVLTLDEFESRYARAVGSSSNAADDSLAEYEDFLERYVNFRLKVEAATDAGIPTSREVMDEIATYRTNLARPYLLEQEVMEPIVRQLYDRQQQLVDVSHILLRVDETASPDDTLTAYKRLEAIRDSAVQGVDFGDLAYRNSEDPSASAREGSLGFKGRLGYFTAGRMIEPFESYAYETPVGDVSPVFRTRFGYHILNVHDRRDAEPNRRISHIMLRPSPAPEDSARAMETMQEVKQRIDAGESFAELAEAYSVDAQSKARGGDIGFIGYDAPIHESFKDVAFGLAEVGDVSDVVHTPYGYHIITLTDVREMKQFEDAYEELKQLAARLPRTRSAEENLARKVIADRAALVDTAFVLNAFRDVPADSVLTRIVQKNLSEDAIAHPILIIGDSTYTFAHVSEFAGSSDLSMTGDTDDRLMSLLTAFVTDSAIEFEAAQLEGRDEEFARLMNEFRDGLILFQFMEDSVWTAAEQDSVALEQYYEANKDKYWWQDRTRIISFQSKSDSLLSVIGRRLDAGESIADLQASVEGDTLRTVTSDTMMIADPTKSVYDRALDIPQGQHTDPISFRGAFVLLVNDGVEGARQKTFEEARTQVVSDFQTIVEDRLIERLRAQYNVRTFPSRLQSAFASVAAGEPVDEVARGE